MAVTPPGIVGRDEELAAVAAFLDGDLPAALLLEGEAGIGKTKGKTQYCDATVRDKIRVVRGNARGARAREVAAIPVANSWPPQNPRSPASPFVHAAFTPGGLFAVETFRFTPDNRSPVAGAFMPLGP